MYFKYINVLYQLLKFTEKKNCRKMWRIKLINKKIKINK